MVVVSFNWREGVSKDTVLLFTKELLSSRYKGYLVFVPIGIYKKHPYAISFRVVHPSRAGEKDYQEFVAFDTEREEVSDYIKTYNIAERDAYYLTLNTFDWSLPPELYDIAKFRLKLARKKYDKRVFECKRKATKYGLEMRYERGVCLYKCPSCGEWTKYRLKKKCDKCAYQVPFEKKDRSLSGTLTRNWK